MIHYDWAVTGSLPLGDGELTDMSQDPSDLIKQMNKMKKAVFMRTWPFLEHFSEHFLYPGKLLRSVLYQRFFGFLNIV